MHASLNTPHLMTLYGATLLQEHRKNKECWWNVLSHKR